MGDTRDHADWEFLLPHSVPGDGPLDHGAALSPCLCPKRSMPACS